jgi:hypothetical protein
MNVMVRDRFNQNYKLGCTHWGAYIFSGVPYFWHTSFLTLCMEVSVQIKRAVLYWHSQALKCGTSILSLCYDSVLSWNVVVLCFYKINYPWLQVYFQHRNRNSGMRVLFLIQLDVTSATKHIYGNNVLCMLLKCSSCYPVTGLQFQAGTTCPKYTGQPWGLLCFLAGVPKVPLSG